MSDPFNPAEPADGLQPDGGPFPWDEPISADANAEPQRHDAFTEARKAEYLKVLAKTGCILDACSKTGVSARTVYRHQESDPRFHDHCRLALRMSATPLELTAWSRAVDGVEQEFACGGQIHVRRRYDAGLLRLLLQGSNPKKYGPRPGFTRKRLLKHERKQMEREIRAAIRAEHPEPSMQEVRDRIIGRLDALARHAEPAKLAAGWTKSPDGHWIPPGYAPIPGYVPPPPRGGVAEGEPVVRETPRDSM